MKQKIVINVLALNISTVCDMGCKRCYGHLDGSSATAASFMDFDTIKKSTEMFLSQLPQSGGDIILYGGEPLLNWGLIEKYIPWYKSLGTAENIQLLICTNGLLLSPEKIDFIFHNNIRPISLSIDGDYSLYKEIRGISKDQYDHIISMVKYALDIDPLLVVPFCVLKKENIPRTYDILSYIVSLGAKVINLYRDLFEDWTQDDRNELVKHVNNIVIEYGVMVQPFCESIFDCRTCYAPSVMIYPNGDIYDACFSMMNVLRQKGLVSEDDCQVLYMGNLADSRGLYLDVEKKRQIIRRHMDCYLVHEDIYTAVNLMQKGSNMDMPAFRVMEMIREIDMNYVHAQS